MKVTTERTRGSRRRPRPRRRLGRLRVSLGVVGLLAYSGLVFGAGIAFFDLLSPMLQDLSGSQSTGRAIRSLVSGPANYLRALANPNAAPQLTIDVKFKHLHKLHQKRELALDSGLLRPTPEDFIPATLTLDGHVVEVDMRLTGHMPEPLEGEKWPLEIRVKGGDHLLGMRRFTLEPPEFRGFQAEGFFLDHLRREGVLVPRFSLLEVTRNGLNIGLMGMEELPSTELLVSQGRKSGAIIRFDDSSYWEAHRTGRQTPFDSPFTARIQAVNEDEIAESSRLQENLESATGLLRGFLAGSLRASEVFDVELLGRFLAVAEIWRTREALVWRNARYYFNPLNARMSEWENSQGRPVFLCK